MIDDQHLENFNDDLDYNHTNGHRDPPPLPVLAFMAMGIGCLGVIAMGIVFGAVISFIKLYQWIF